MPELIRLGNCGSPIDTEAGGRANSPGVGPMGALLPDHHDPDEVGRPVSQTGVPAEIPAPQCNFCIPPQRQLKGAPPRPPRHLPRNGWGSCFGIPLAKGIRCLHLSPPTEDSHDTESRAASHSRDLSGQSR